MLGEKTKNTSPKGMVSVPRTEGGLEESQPRTKIIPTPIAIIVTKHLKKKLFLNSSF